jgi:hypothetical protein
MNMKTTLLDPLRSNLPGKSLFVALTFVDVSGELLDQHQTSGTVESITDDGYLLLRQPDDSLFRLPADPKIIQVASPGEYRVRNSGQKILNPDFLGQWEIAVRSVGEMERYREGGFPLMVAS